MEIVKWDGKTDSDIILEALLLLIDEEDEEKALTTSYGDFGKYLQKLYKAAGAGNGKYSIRTNKKVSVILHKKQVQYELTWNKAAKLIHEYLHRKEKQEMCKECHSNPCRPQCPNADPEQAYTCDQCESPIYAGDTYYSITEDIAICEDCMRSRRRTAEVM